MAPLSRNAQVLRYLLQAAPALGRTKLLKFAYLADCAARSYLGRPISEFRYRRYEQGPFDQAFYTACEELQSQGLVRETRIEFPGGYVGSEYQPTGGPVEFDFDLAEAELLRVIAQTYMHMTARDLCDEVVYQTEPMRDAKMNEELPMDRLDKGERDRLGFDLERLIRSEASVDDGRFRPLSEAVDELRARLNA